MGSDHVSSLTKGLEVLQAFNRERPELTISEVARIVGVTPAAARRSLLTLKDLGFIATHGKRYLLTPRVLRLSEAFLSSVSVQEVMHQFLQEIVDRTGDSASVGVLDGVDVVYVATVSVKRPYQLTPTVGTRYPAYASSLGHAILSASTPDVVEDVLARSELRRFTDKTLVDRSDLLAAIKHAATVGIAGSDELLTYGVISVAMPILDTDGQVVAAVNCATTPGDVGFDRLLETRRNLLERARFQISEALRQHPVLAHSVRGRSQ
ncbi:IclR family transcriptional regulator C-terminal domain-containing protein [Streptomyces sp. NPDC006355]|uniref:IclR family transcriptional regulator domain-containing protein n=1 Tax=Streptomyces sp. NPDC006355 TaxID=3156758 RepID=UPI0033A09A03